MKVHSLQFSLVIRLPWNKEVRLRQQLHGHIMHNVKKENKKLHQESSFLSCKEIHSWRHAYICIISDSPTRKTHKDLRMSTNLRWLSVPVQEPPWTWFWKQSERKKGKYKTIRIKSNNSKDSDDDGKCIKQIWVIN